MILRDWTRSSRRYFDYGTGSKNKAQEGREAEMPKKRRRKYVKKVFRPKPCGWKECGIVFTPQRKWQRFHSDSCRGKAWSDEHPRTGHQERLNQPIRIEGE